MGLFNGFINYDKPGPGVDKNEPKKKGISLFFSIFIEKFWKFIPLSLIYIFTSLLIVTNGLAEAGTAYITRNFSRRKPVILVADYFDTIKKNWKQAIVVGIINLLVTVLIICAMLFYYENWNQSFFFKAGFVISGCLMIVFTFLRYYTNMLLVTFNLSIKQIYKNSLLLSSAGLKENVIITAFLAVLYIIVFGFPFLWWYLFDDLMMFLISIVLCVLFLPAIQSFIIQFFVFPVIKKHMIDPYYKEHPEKAKKDRALLNLFDDEDEETEEQTDNDVVFKDMGTKETAPAVSDNEKTKSIPKQYSKKELKRIRHNKDDDDDTI